MRPPGRKLRAYVALPIENHLYSPAISDHHCIDATRDKCAVPGCRVDRPLGNQLPPELRDLAQRERAQGTARALGRIRPVAVECHPKLGEEGGSALTHSRANL